MEEIKKILEEIMDYQMNNVQLARTTKPYLLAKKGIEISLIEKDYWIMLCLW